MVVEDEAGPRVPEEGAVDEGEEEIDLDTFYGEFIRPGREARMSLPRSKIPPPNNVWRSCSARSKETATALIADDTRTGER